MSVECALHDANCVVQFVEHHVTATLRVSPAFMQGHWLGCLYYALCVWFEFQKEQYQRAFIPSS